MSYSKSTGIASSKSILSTSRDFLIGLVIFSATTFVLVADFDQPGSAVQIGPLSAAAASHRLAQPEYRLPSVEPAGIHSGAVETTAVGTGQAAPTFRSTNIVVAARPSPTQASVLQAIGSADIALVALKTPSTFASQQLAMALLAVLFATISVAVCRSVRHLNVIALTPRLKSRKKLKYSSLGNVNRRLQMKTVGLGS